MPIQLSMRTALRASSGEAVHSSLKKTTKAAPILALIQLDQSSGEIIRKAFTQCGIQVVKSEEEFSHRVVAEKFEGCVLRLDDRAEAILEAIRSSPSNRRVIIYGIASEDTDTRRFSKYGINAIIEVPLDRAAIARTARATCALLLQELRRYVRIPLVLEVTIESTSGKLSGSSREISRGGISVQLPGETPSGNKFRLAFTLPDKPPVRIAAAVCWKQGPLIGFQFDDADRGRELVKSWIDSFLRLS